MPKHFLLPAETDVQRQRELRARGGHSRDEAEELWQQTSKTGALCAGCFRELTPDDSVTMQYRRVGYRRHHNYVRVPVCMDCWLNKERQWKTEFSWQRWDRAGNPYLRRVRCLTCRRRMRVWWDRGALPLAQRCCCKNCYRLMRNAQARQRRARDHDRVCVVCRRPFVPKRVDARTCSNVCRQRLFRSMRGAGARR